MCIIGVEIVELVAYQLKNVARTWFDQWKEGRGEDAPHSIWACFEKAFLGRFIIIEMKESKLHELLSMKQDSLSVQEYVLKITQQSLYALKMLKI